MKTMTSAPVPHVDESCSSVKDATVHQVRKSAKKLGFHLDRREARAVTESVNGSLTAFKRLATIPDYLPQVKVARLPGYFPSGEENKYNGWYVKTNIKAPDSLLTSKKLAGKTVAVKDCICVAGVQMMNGSAILEGYIPDCDATVVQRVLEAGGTIAGKAMCSDLCFSFTTGRGDVLNPRNTDHSAGGSSSGSASLVASRHVDMALGGDQGGSIRIPSAWCGTYGLKPTYGLIPYTGTAGIEHSIDTVGPMTNTTFDNALMLEAIAGPDGLDHRQGPPNNPPEEYFSNEGSPWPIPQSDPQYHYTDGIDQGINGIRIGIVKEGFADTENVVAMAVRKAAETLEGLGAVVEEISIPWHSLGAIIWTGIGMSKGLLDEEFGDAHGTGYRGVYVTSLVDKFTDARRNHANKVSDPYPRDPFVAAQYIKDTYGTHFYAKSQNLARKLTFEYDKALRKYDILLMPTIPILAPVRQIISGLEKYEYHGSLLGLAIQNVSPFNISGHPALSVPCGITPNGLPIGMQLVSKKLGEKMLYRASYAFEHNQMWTELSYPTSKL